MQRLALSTVLIALIGFVFIIPVGCNNSSTNQQTPQATPGPEPTQQESAPPTETTQYTGPAASVYTFLEGARRGDDRAVASMLTATARQKLDEYGLTVAPKASDRVRFVIGEVRQPNEQVAHVVAQKIEQNVETGLEQVENVTWVLRHDPEGWRIAGMARVVFPGEPMMLLNFEDPEDMIRQAKMLQDELARRAQASGVPSMAKTPNSPQQR